MHQPPALVPDDDHNRSLVAQVRPGHWRNPTPDGRYNLVAIGAGTAGLVAAAGAAGLGARVALVERHLMGGDCLNVGCVPSKAVIRSAHAAHAVADASRFGVRAAGTVEVDFDAVMRRMRRVRSEISPHDSARRFAEHYGVHVYFGEARFTGRDRLDVAGQELRFTRAVIATGARPLIPPVPGLAAAGFLTNETVFNLTRQPRRMAVVGGGPIGCELAQAFARLGTEVTIIEIMDRLLPRDDIDAAALLQSSMERDGVVVMPSTRLEAVTVGSTGKILALVDSDGERHLEVDEMFIAVGRTPNIEDLDLAAAGVVHDREGVIVDDHLRTSNRLIFASGDVCLPAKFTHVADAASRVVLRNALFPGPKARFSRLDLAWATYTDPEIAHVGMDAVEAGDRGLDIETITIPMTDVDRALADGDTEGFLKLHVDPGKGTIHGATLVCRRAGDLISEITTAMHAGLRLGDMASVIHPYPTVAEAVRKAADRFNRRRLTPLAARILDRWFRWTR